MSLRDSDDPDRLVRRAGAGKRSLTQEDSGGVPQGTPAASQGATDAPVKRTKPTEKVRYSYIDQEWEYDPETLDERLSVANAKEAGLEDIAVDEASKRNSLGRKRKSWLKDNENDVTENPVKEVNETDLDNDLEPIEPTTDLDPEEGATNGDENQQGDEPGGTDEEDVVEQDDVLYETFLGAYGNKLQGLEETFRKEKDNLLNELTGGISANRGRTVPCVGERPTAGMPAEAGPGAYQNSDSPEPTHAKRPKHEGPGISPDAILAAMIMEKLSGQKPIRTHVGRAKEDDLSFHGSKEEIPTLPYRTLKGHQALPPGMGPPHYSPRESGRGRGDPRHGYPYRPGDRPSPQPRPRPEGDADRPRPAPKRNPGPIIHGARPHGAPAPPRTPEPELIDDPVLGAVSAALEQKEAYERERQEGRDPMVFVETCLGVDGDFYNSPRKERKFGIKRDMSVDALTDDRPKRELSMDTRAKSLERGLEEARREETSLDQPMDTGVSTTLDRGRDRERQMRAKKPLVNGSDGSLNGSRERVKPAVKPKPKIPEKLRQEFRASSAERKTGPTMEAKVSTSVEIGTVERTIVSKQQQQNESAVIEVVELSDTSGKSSEGTPNTSAFDVSKHGQSSNSSSKDNSKPGSGGHKPHSATDDLLYNAMFQQSIDAAIARQVAARSKPRDRTASLEHERDRAASRDRKERDRAAFFKDKDRDASASLERDRAASVETRERDRTASTERTSPRDQSASLDRSVNRSKDTVEIHTPSKSLPRSKDQKSREKPKGAQDSYSSSQSSFSSDAKDSPRQVDTMIRVTTQKSAGPILSGSTPTSQKQTSGPVLAGSTPQSTSKGPVIAGHQPDTSREVNQEIGTVERSVDVPKGGIKVPTPFVVARNADGYASVEGKPQRRYKKKSETNVVYTEVEVSDSFRTPNKEMKFDADTSKPRSASNDRRLEMELTPKSGSKDKRKKGNDSRSRKNGRNASFDSPQYSLETNDTTYAQDSMAEAAVRGAVRDRVHDIFGEESTLSPVTPAGQVMDDRSSTPMNAGRKDRKGSGGFFSFGSKRKPKKSRDQMASGESSLDTTLNTTMDSNFDKKSLASMGSQEVLNETAKRKENKHKDRNRQRSKDRTVKTKDKKLRGKEALREVTNQDVDSIQDMYIEGDDDLLQKEDLENLGRVPIEMTSTPDNQRRVKKKVREKRTEVEVVDMQESSFREVPKGDRTRPSQDDVESDYYTTQDVMSAMIVGAMEGKRRTPRKKTRQRNEGDRSLERSVDLDEERVEITEVSVEERKEGRGRTERRYKKKTQDKPSPATAAVMSELLLRVGATPGRQESERVEDGEVRYRKKANKRTVRAEEDSSSREDEPSSERRGRRPTDLRVQNGEKYQEYSIKWNEYPEDKFDETSFSGLDVSLDDVLQERENRKSEVFRMLLEDTAFERKLRRLAEKRAKQMKREERGSDSGADGSSERTPRSSEYSSLERSSESIDEADLLRELERRIEEYFERQKQNKIKILLKKFLAEEGGRMSKLMSHSQDVLDLIALKDRELYGEFVEPKLPPAPEAAPPEFGRSVLYVDADIFEELDTEVIEIAQVEQESYIELVRDLTKRCRDELDRVRAIFRWITVKDLNRIRFPKEKINPESLLGMLKGIKDGTSSYHDLFKRLCGYAGIHCHVIQGFSKGAGFRPGMKVEHKAFRNTWTAVNVSKSWRFVNCNWGARHYKNAKEIKDPKNKLCYKCDEFYFLTDPEDHIFQHFPDDKKWQLLRHPISIGEFMRLPVLKSPFFNGGLKLVRKIGDRVHTQEGQVEIVLKMRKFVGLHCTLELIENKTVVPEPEGHTLIRIIDDEVIFTVAPPDIGRYFFNVYVAENWKSNSLEHAAAFLVIAGDDCFDNGSNGVFPSTGVIGKTPVMADLGIGIPRDQDPWVHLSWQTEVTLPFSLKRDVKLSHQMRLFNREGKYVGDYDNFVFLRYKGDKSYCVRCPKEGVYALSIFAGDAKDRSPKLECILKYLINCESAVTNAPPFPKPSRKWIGCTLHEPIIGELEVNSKYKFALEIPDAVEVSVVIGDKWQSLQYSESTTDMWEGKVSTGHKPGVTASVLARYDEKSDKFSSLLDYTVIAKSSRTPHGMHRSASSSRAVEDLFR